MANLTDLDRDRFLTRDELAEYCGIYEHDYAVERVEKNGIGSGGSGLTWGAGPTTRAEWLEVSGLGDYDFMRALGERIYTGTLPRLTSSYAVACFKSFLNSRSYSVDVPEGITAAEDVEDATGLTLGQLGIEGNTLLLFDSQQYQRYMQDTLPMKDMLSSGVLDTAVRGCGSRGIKPTSEFDGQEEYAAYANTALAQRKRPRRDTGKAGEDTVSPWWLDEPVSREEFLREYGNPLIVAPHFRLDSEFNEDGLYIGHSIYGA